MQVFPTWRYHKTEPPKLVHSAEELDLLGPEWADTPAAFVEEPAVEPPQAAPTQEKVKRKKRGW
ncbi:MAG: hypothetical protein AB7G93_09530 [Bdellovibrionales bacterium]